MADNYKFAGLGGITGSMRTTDLGSNVHVPHFRFADDTVVAGPATQSVINTDLITGTVSGWYDVAGFQTAAVQIVATAGISAGAIIFEQTNDTTAAPAGAAVMAQETSSLTANPIVAAVTIAASTARVFVVNLNARFFRVRISTAFVGGTVQGIASFACTAPAHPVVNVQQATATSLNATVAQPTAASLNATVVQATAASLNVTNVPVTPTTTFVNSAGTTNGSSIKASAGTVWSVSVSNINAAARFLKLYNLAVAPTVGTSVPVLTIPIPAGGVVSIAGGANGIRFATGIAIAITAAAADSDTTAVAANEIKVAVSFT